MTFAHLWNGSDNVRNSMIGYSHESETRRGEAAPNVGAARGIGDQARTDSGEEIGRLAFAVRGRCDSHGIAIDGPCCLCLEESWAAKRGVPRHARSGRQIIEAKW